MLSPTIKILCLTCYFSRTDGGYWRKKPYEAHLQSFNIQEYRNLMDSVPIFKDRVRRAYTEYGYLPRSLTCFRWGDGDIKCVRSLYYYDKDDTAYNTKLLELQCYVNNI